MIKVKPQKPIGRQILTIKIEPEILDILKKRIYEDSKQLEKSDYSNYIKLGWDRSSYIRRVLIKHLNIELEDF